MLSLQACIAKLKCFLHLFVLRKVAETAQQVQKEEVKSIQEKVEEDKKKEEERIRNRLSQIRVLALFYVLY